MYHTAGYVAVDVPRKLIIVAYRGTNSTDPLSGKTNTDSLGHQTPVNYCPGGGCNVATGYLNAFNESRSHVIPAVEAALKANPKFQVITVGHSLGGALATVAALELRNMGIHVHTVSVFPTTIPMLPNTGCFI
jgi:pimeloyl-ACP methyl ester carboxylesterase